MIFVDTGYLLALLDRRDQLHARAVAWHRVLREPLLTTEYVLWEIVNAFSAREDRAKAHAAVEAIRSTPEWNLVAATPQMFDAGLALHRQRPDKDWSLTDCLSFTVMERHGIRQSLTPDHHFEQAGFDAVLRRDPP